MSDELEARAAPVIIHLPDQSQPEPAPAPTARPPGKHTGRMKGRHFGARPAADPRTAWLSTRCTPAFRASVLAAATQAGLSLADYVHERLGGEPSRRVRRSGPNAAATARLMAALGRSGNNLNQLFRRVGSYDFLVAPGLVEMFAVMKAAHAAHHELVAALKTGKGVSGPDEAARMTAALGRSGNNLNQLLQRVNSYDFRGHPGIA